PTRRAPFNPPGRDHPGQDKRAPLTRATPMGAETHRSRNALGPGRTATETTSELRRWLGTVLPGPHGDHKRSDMGLRLGLRDQVSSMQIRPGMAINARLCPGEGPLFRVPREDPAPVGRGSNDVLG